MTPSLTGTEMIVQLSLCTVFVFKLPFLFPFQFFLLCLFLDTVNTTLSTVSWLNFATWDKTSLICHIMLLFQTLSSNPTVIHSPIHQTVAIQIRLEAAVVPTLIHLPALTQEALFRCQVSFL